MANSYDNTGLGFELVPDLARLAAQQSGAQQAFQQAQLPATAFVASLNGEGGAIALQSGTVPSGITVTFVGGAGTVTFNFTGAGTMITKNVAAAVADQATVASAGYVQAEAQATIDKLNALLGSLRTAGHLAP